jgi:hypothetical protein
MPEIIGLDKIAVGRVPDACYRYGGLVVEGEATTPYGSGPCAMMLAVPFDVAGITLRIADGPIACLTTAEVMSLREQLRLVIADA